MSKMNKSPKSDSDDAKGCFLMYFNCLVVAPLQAIFCLPFVCCARRMERTEKNKIISGAYVPDPPPATKSETAAGMPMGDASKPKDQWPADWHAPQADEQHPGGPVARTDYAGGTSGGGLGPNPTKMKFINGVKKATQPVL
ncbi:hypothetical protein B0H66DRAFT_530138 [Apodospora peruviana]|uniref:Uncharacterized protein n=1 Tax=Apodospora peruviana TaxID=516989 RepID=A0AAE0MC00_9PEZI|nr:hypothetical protein B0H66DRAFT_530138 [Apodospora peruviana]